MISTTLLALLFFSLTSCRGRDDWNVQQEQKAQTPRTAIFPERFRNHYEATGSKFMVVSQGEATTRAAREILNKGGNVIDAAAAASFAIAVERPQSTGIAGGGFMVIHFSEGNRDIAVDFRERAPLAATEKMFQNVEGQVVHGLSTNGALAVGVPGVVAGVIDVHKKYGKFPLETILAPAIKIAEEGVLVYPHLAQAIKEKAPLLGQNADGISVFFDAKGAPLAEGALMKQPVLAKVLREIASKGRDGFYKGWVAQAILEEQSRLGGLIRQQDFDDYQTVYRSPVRGRYGDYEVLSMPPPSSGGVHVVQMLNVLEGFPLVLQGPFSTATVHQTASAMQLAYHDRSKYLGDSDFVKVPIKGLTSEAYAAEQRKSIAPDKSKSFKEVSAPSPAKYESLETTHFTIADQEGNVVSSTQTINGWFGSGVVVPGTGMVLNNEMDDFSAKPGVPNKFGVIGGTANAIQPGKRPLSSMSPTIVKKDGRPVLALGSPSGSQIITCVTLTILNYLTYQMPLYDSVTAIRYHHQWTPDELIVEKPGFEPQVNQELMQMGYTVKATDMGCKVQAVAYEATGLKGVSDPRGEGLAASEAVVSDATRSSPNPNNGTVPRD